MDIHNTLVWKFSSYLLHKQDSGQLFRSRYIRLFIILFHQMIKNLIIFLFFDLNFDYLDFLIYILIKQHPKTQRSVMHVR